MRFGSFGGGLAGGLVSGYKLGEILDEARQNEELRNAASSNQVTNVVSGDEALQHFKDNYVPQEGGPATAKEFLAQHPDLFAGLAGRRAGYAVGDKQFGDRTAAMLAAKGLNIGAQADVYEKSGEPEKAQKLRSTWLALQKAEQDRADDDEMRRVLAGGIGNSLGRRNDALRSSIGGGADLGGASAVLEHKPNPDDAQGRSGAPQAAGGDLDTYLTSIAPRAMNTLVRQGRFAEAKAFGDFMDSDQGRKYASLWLSGVRKHAVGDSEGAIKDFAQLYNSQAYPDGRTVKFSPAGDGQYRIERYDDSGNVIDNKTGKVADLANQAVLALSPAHAVKYMAEQQSARAKEAGILDRNIQLEELRQQGQEYREDRRDERLARRLEVDRERKAAGGGLTTAQQRTNDSIIAARKQLAGMSQDDVLKRTQAYDKVGRENRNYDPQLASTVKLANTLLYGDDPEHEKFTAGRQQQNQVAARRADVAKRFRMDPEMNAYRLGRETPDGLVEVLDKAGNVVGHFE